MTAGWHFTLERGKVGWLGLAKRSQFVTGSVTTEPGEVWYQTGGTRTEALRNIREFVAKVRL